MMKNTVVNFCVSMILWCHLPAFADNYCFEEAGSRYGIAPLLLQAISKVESNGNAYAVNTNSFSQTVDIGHMQINSSWRKYLGQHYAGLYNACYCTMVGAWILRQCVDRYGYDWEAVACYHTGYGLSDARSGLKKQNGEAYIARIKQQLATLK